MTNLENRVIHLEQLIKRQADEINRLKTALAIVQQAVRTSQPGSFGGGGGGTGIYSMTGVVISAGGNATGQTVNILNSGSATAISTDATVYNQMQSATVATLTIMLGQNPDGTFSVISQSC